MARREKEPVHKVVMTEGKKRFFQSLSVIMKVQSTGCLF